MAADPNYIPDPPPSAPKRLPKLVPDSPKELWRLHWEADPRRPRRYAYGKFRFDAPAGEYSVTYANEDQSACFAEVYGDEQEIPPSQLERRLGRLTYARPLRLVPLDDGEALKALHPKLDLNISASTRYARTRAWSLALHAWYEDADGLLYLGRHATQRLNRCLFLDRCAKDLIYEPVGKLQDLEDDVRRAAAAYNLAPRLFDTRAPTGWP